eukprot:EG_transcript_9958
MKWVIPLLTFLVSLSSGSLPNDVRLRHAAVNKPSKLVATKTRNAFQPQNAKFQPQATCTSGTVCFEPQPGDPVQVPGMMMVVYRMEFVDLMFNDTERAFDYRSWYNSSWNGSTNTFGGFVRRNTRGQTFVKLVDVDRDFYNATVSHAAILSALQGVVAQDPDADVEQLYFNAIVNIMFDIIKDRSTTSVYQTFAVHVPYNGLFTLARTGQGFAVAGMGQVDAREFTYRWGLALGMRGGGLLRPAVSLSQWAAIPEGDSISGLGYMPGTTLDQFGHWPAHEKRRAGYFRPGIEMQDINASGVYRLYAHNRYLNGTLSRTPLDGTLAIKVGKYTNTWYVSYNDIDNMPVGATLYITTPDPVFGYLLVDASPDTDACPTCPTGYNCGFCTKSNTTAVVVGTSYDAKYFTIATTNSGADSLGNKFIDVNITFSTTVLCPLPNYYGTDCQTPCWGGVTKCGFGNCSAGPSGSGYCSPCARNYLGVGCNENDYCDVDNLAPKNPVAALASYYTPTRY